MDNRFIHKLLLAILYAACIPVVAAATEQGSGDHAGHAASGHDPHAHHRAMLQKEASAAQAAEVNLLDLELQDQHGNQLRFASDVIGDRIVVMDFIYTSCTTVCPVISAVLGQVQDRLGDHLGDQVRLVSVSIDPVRDTPARLRAYSERQHAGPDWLWLTGIKRTMDNVLDGLGAYSPNFETHPSMVLVGDGRTGEWSRFFGFPSPERIVEQVELLRAKRADIQAIRSSL